MSKPAPPRSALNTFLALYLVLPLITLLSWIFKNPSVEKYLASCGVLYFSDVPGSFVPEFLKGNGPAQYVSGLYERLKVDKSYLGGFTLFNKTYYVTRDPGLIREICVKDVTQIERTESTLSFAGDYIISKSLVYLQGDHWKKTRAKFDRGFTPSKIKHNFAQINHVGRNLVEYFNHEMDPAGSLVCDLNLPIHKYSLDVVASVTLNLDTVCLKTREPSRFEQISDRVYTSFDKFTDWVKPMFILWLPRVTNYFRVTIMDKEIGTFYGDVAQAKIQSEGGAGKKNLNDFVHLIHSSYKELYGREAIGRGANGRGAIGREAIGRGANGREEDEKDFIISNLYTLVLTGYETTEVVLAMCAYELALNPNVQRRLRDEIKDVLGDEFTYDGVCGMTYLDMVIHETLRMYPPLGMVPRVCIQEYAVPNSKVILRPGDSVILSIHGFQRDEEYHPNPDVFDPDRFSTENRSTTEFAYFPFGHGVRMCIGMRIALLEVKLGVCHIVQNFELAATPETLVPMRIPASMTTARPENVVLSLTKIG